MKFGVGFPHDQTLLDPGAVRTLAQAIDELGFSFLTASDHVVGADLTNRPDWKLPHSLANLNREPLMLLSFIAACTRRIMLGTSVLIMPQRQTALVAKQMAELDILSGGRAMLGIGVGRVELEYKTLNEDFKTRGRRLEAQIGVLRAFWTQPSVSIEDEWHHIDAVGINPLPVQRPIPIWMGASAEPALKRIARLADGWLPSSSTARDFPNLLERFTGWMREAGRDPSEISIAPRMQVNGEDTDAWAREMEDWERLGVTHLALSLGRGASESPDARIDVLRKFAEAVGISRQART
jgi:probable F420-dependent oxidoreductase